MLTTGGFKPVSKANSKTELITNKTRDEFTKLARAKGFRLATFEETGLTELKHIDKLYWFFTSNVCPANKSAEDLYPHLKELASKGKVWLSDYKDNTERAVFRSWDSDDGCPLAAVIWAASGSDSSLSALFVKGKTIVGRTNVNFNELEDKINRLVTKRMAKLLRALANDLEIGKSD